MLRVCWEWFAVRSCLKYISRGSKEQAGDGWLRVTDIVSSAFHDWEYIDGYHHISITCVQSHFRCIAKPLMSGLDISLCWTLSGFKVCQGRNTKLENRCNIVSRGTAPIWIYRGRRWGGNSRWFFYPAMARPPLTSPLLPSPNPLPQPSRPECLRASPLQLWAKNNRDSAEALWHQFWWTVNNRCEGFMSHGGGMC